MRYPLVVQSVATATTAGAGSTPRTRNLVDIQDPYRPTEVGYFVPDPVGGGRSAQSNDVFYDGKGLLYVIDRFNGLDILERSR